MALDLPDPGEKPWGTKLNSAITAVDNDLQSTKTSLDARLDSLEAAPPGGGVTDHGLLNGLADNDHPQYQLAAAKGVGGGYAGLDSNGKVPSGQLPPGSGGSLPDDVSGAWYTGRYWYALGTSITAENSYTAKLATLSGMVLLNKGVGGASLSTAANGSIWNALTGQVGTDAEVITIETINDFRLNVPLGAVTDTENPATSYYGALRAACNWILTNRPAARAFLLTAYGDAYVGGYPNGETANSFGKQYWEYNDAMRRVGQIYGIPVINVGEESGINFHTCQYYTNDMIHMNANGGQRYGEYVWAKIRSLGWMTSRPTAPGAAAPVSVSGVTIVQGSAIALAPGGTQQLSALIAPSNASNKGVTWSSGTPAVATTSSDGMITAVANGTSVITVTTADGGKTATCTVTVAVAAATSVTVSPTVTVLLPTQTQQLTPTVLPSNAGNKAVTYSSNATGVATVNSTGLITAVANGSAVITVTTVDGGFTATCAVTVSSTIPVTDVSLDPDAVSGAIGSTAQLTATVLPANATNKAVSYVSNTPSVATVDSSGLVTFVTAGSAVITVTTTDGGKTDTSAITVSASDWNLHKATAYTGFGVTGLGVDGGNDPTWSGTNWTYSAIILNDVNAGDNACEWVAASGSGDACWVIAGSNNADVFSAVGDMKPGASLEVFANAAGFIGTNGSPTGYSILSALGNVVAGTKIRMARKGDWFYLWKWNGTGWTEHLRVDMRNQGTKWKTDPTKWATQSIGVLVGAPYAKPSQVYTGTYQAGAVVPLTGISVTPATGNAVVGGATLPLSVAYSPSDATNKAMNWSSDAPGVAAVNAAGVVSGVSPGTATITGTSVDGGFSDTCVVTVTDAADEWALAPQTTFRDHNLTGATGTGSNPTYAGVTAGTYGAIILNNPGDNAIEWTVEDGSKGLWVCVGAKAAPDPDFAGMGDMTGAGFSNVGTFDNGSIAPLSITTAQLANPAYATGKVYRMGRSGNRVKIVRVDAGPTLVTIWDGDLDTNFAGGTVSAFYATVDLGLMQSPSYSKPINCKTGVWTPP